MTDSIVIRAYLRTYMTEVHYNNVANFKGLRDSTGFEVCMYVCMKVYIYVCVLVPTYFPIYLTYLPTYLQIVYSPVLRQHDAGMMVVGSIPTVSRLNLTSPLSIPPGR